MNNKNIFSLRVREKLSVEELSSIIDVPVDTIRAWENDEKEPTLRELKKLAVFYNVSADYLLGLEEKTTKPIYEQPTYQPQTASTVTAPHTVARVKKPVLAKGWYIAIPSAIFVMFIFMLCPFFEYYDYSMFQLVFEVGWAEAICTFVFSLVFLLYFSTMLFLNKKNLAKMNIANTIVLGCSFVTNLVLAICVVAKTYDGIGACGVFLLIVWFALALYCAVMAVLMLVKFNKPAIEENYYESLTPEQKALTTENHKIIMSKQERAEFERKKKIASMTPAERQDRVAKANKVKMRPWVALIPFVAVLLFVFFAFTIRIYSEIYYYDTTLFNYASCYGEIGEQLAFYGIILGMVALLAEPIVMTILNKKEKKEETALYGIISNAVGVFLFVCGLLFCIHVIEEEFGIQTMTLTYIFIMIGALIYCAVRLATCIRKYVILRKAKYLY